MADQRLFLVREDGTNIVIAVRHGWDWRGAIDKRNEIGKFLNDLGEDEQINLLYENDRWPARDPEIQ